MKKYPLTAVILTKNEENNIGRALMSVEFCLEKIVVDDFSVDKTIYIAKKHGATVLKHKMRGDFSSSRNFGLKSAHQEWVLFLDADEVVMSDLQKEIIQAIKDTTCNGYMISRKDILFDKAMKHGEVSNVKILRLARRKSGKWVRKVHEIWKVSGEIGVLTCYLAHYPHPTIHEFISDIGSRFESHSEEISREGKKSSILKIIVWPCGKFLYGMVAQLGLLDGTHGFILAVMMSFHSFLAWSNIWLTKNSYQ